MGLTLTVRVAASLVVVEADVVADAGPEFLQGNEGVTVDVLVFEDRPETLSASVVVTLTGLSHRVQDLELLTELDDLGIVEFALQSPSLIFTSNSVKSESCRVSWRANSKRRIEIFGDPSAPLILRVCCQLATVAVRE